ncbi:MAG TPA: hypothetical protein VGF95_14320 [Solirubrobacteraceae bacterium]|jgi:hypothetical protein
MRAELIGGFIAILVVIALTVAGHVSVPLWMAWLAGIGTACIGMAVGALVRDLWERWS